MSTLTNTLFVGKVLLHLNKIDSTNTHALNLLSKNKPSEGTVISTYNQVSGRGQIGRSWVSAPGKNLTFSIIFYPTFLPANQQFILSQAVALGVFDFVNQKVGNAKVKWPNDIYINDSKIAGILIQNTLSGMNIQSSVIGVGININQMRFDESLPNPTSLILETHKEHKLEAILEQICERIETRYLQLRAKNHSLIEKEYLANMYRFQEEALYRYPSGETFKGKIVGISESGKLIIHHQRGEELFDVRTIEFVLDSK